MPKSTWITLGIFAAVLLFLFANSFLSTLKPKITIVVPPPKIIEQMVVAKPAMKLPMKLKLEQKHGLLHKLHTLF